MRQRYTILVVAAVIASVIAPGAAMAAPVADQVQQPDEAPEEASVNNVTVSGVSADFTLDEMTLNSSEGDVYLEDANVTIENASVVFDGAEWDENALEEKLVVEGGELSIENATVSAATVEITMDDGTAVTMTDETFSIEDEELMIENGSFERMPGIEAGQEISVGPVTVDRDTAQQALQNASVESMTIDGASGEASVEHVNLDNAVVDDRTANALANGIEATFQNGSVMLEGAAVENGSLVVESGSAEVDEGDAQVGDARIQTDGQLRETILNEEFSFDDASTQFSNVELTPQDVMEWLNDAADR